MQMLDVENTKWVSLIPANWNSQGEQTVETLLQHTTSWTNINLNDAQDLLNKVATTSPLGDRRKEQVEANRQRLQEITDLIQKLKAELFSAGMSTQNGDPRPGMDVNQPCTIARGAPNG